MSSRAPLNSPSPDWEQLPDPTPEMLASPEFEAVWQCIKGWDIAVPGAYSGYTGAQGNHVRAILDALSSMPSHFTPSGASLDLLDFGGP